MDPLRGFANLRTRPIERSMPPEKRRCQKCHAVLLSGNITDTCSPCSLGEVDVPEWMVAVVESDDRKTTIDHLASLLTGGPRFNDRYRPNRERTDKVRRLYATGDYSWSDLARMFGVAKGTIEDIINRRSKSHHKPATQS